MISILSVVSPLMKFNKYYSSMKRCIYDIVEKIVPDMCGREKLTSHEIVVSTLQSEQKGKVSHSN